MRETDARLLVVDDDPDVRRLMQYALDTVGEVTAVPDVYQALAQLRGEPFDAIVLDLIFPGASGFDLMDRLITQDVATPVVIVTGLASDAAMRRARALGAGAFVTKPFDVDLLVTTVIGAISAARREVAGDRRSTAAAP
jgi:two-component system OmpR family response regulator